MPNSRASVGHAAGWPNASGEYSTSRRPPHRSASAAPSSRLRTNPSPDGICSSGSTYHGPTWLATRVVPGRLRDGTTLLPSGWRIRPAGRSVSVGTLPMGLVTLSDGSLMVANNGYGPNGLMRIDPVKGAVVWEKKLPAWLGLARSGGEWRDTVWVSGAGTNRVYRLTWQGGMAWTLDSVALADTNARVFPGGIALVPRRGLVAVVGNQSDSVYLIDAATLARRGSVAVGRRPYGAVADSAHLYVSDWGDSTVSVSDLSP